MKYISRILSLIIVASFAFAIDDSGSNGSKKSTDEKIIIQTEQSLQSISDVNTLTPATPINVNKINQIRMIKAKRKRSFSNHLLQQNKNNKSQLTESIVGAADASALAREKNKKQVFQKMANDISAKYPTVTLEGKDGESALKFPNNINDESN